uniref:CCHC-type domain-containing protein n=1 Tax=Xenopus tropicalis TaxID=8364 RepID=A0A803JIF1_XENTR
KATRSCVFRTRSGRERDPEGIGGFMRPPSNFLIGRNRGYLFYSGMPLYCRNCLRFGHTSEDCSEAKQARCNKCGRPGHVAAICTYLKVCNMCGKEGHIYRDCPSKAKKEGAGAKLVKSGFFTFILYVSFNSFTANDVWDTSWQ